LIKTQDLEAQDTLWRAISDAAEKLSDHCRVCYRDASGAKITFDSPLPLAPEIENWRLFEALCLLMVLRGADHVHCPQVDNLFGRNERLHIIDERVDQYVWTQMSVEGQSSLLGSVPDIMVTDIQQKPTPDGIRRIIECKSGERIGAPLIRAEFGKSFDLNPGSYLIWSYKKPPPSAVRGAKNLGIDLVGVGFDTAKRTELLKPPKNLQEYVLGVQKKSKLEGNFARAIIRAGEDKASKFLLAR
jgi:hypothetical protein